MELADKLKILSGGAKYDVSCATSGAVRANPRGRLESTPGICHTWSSDGRCVSLLKVLFTNACRYNCRYCVNRRSNDVPRTSFTPEELARLTMDFYIRNYIEGLFLSSGVVKSPDYTMELMLRAVRLLRQTHRFSGYIHLKIIPGCSAVLVDEAARLADRISVNAEFATPQSLTAMAPDKNWDAVLTPMARASAAIEEGARRRKAAPFRRDNATATGQSTQFIVGATPETDANILLLADRFYRRERLKRVYYSAYVPVNADAPAVAAPLLREHRLYQADWLMRFYGFGVREIVSTGASQGGSNGGMLDLLLDPKAAWAVANMSRFPIEVNTAPYEELLRVPGLGIRSAERIIQARRKTSLSLEDLLKLRVSIKRARHFLTAGGRYGGDAGVTPDRVRQKLIAADSLTTSQEKQFTFLEPASSAEESWSLVTGEL